MSKSYREDLTGQRFGRLTVLEFVPNDKCASYWRCRCDCGNTTVAQAGDLKNQHTTSCGCFQKEMVSKISTRTKHELCNTRLYTIWAAMKNRCYNKNFGRYNDYGGRGIAVCDEWKDDFQTFYDWSMSNGYNDSLSIDRIDNNGNYEPLNCRWADAKTQTRNRNITIMVEYKGKKIPLIQAAELSGINYGTLRDRYYRGDRNERLFRPLDKQYRKELL